MKCPKNVCEVGFLSVVKPTCFFVFLSRFFSLLKKLDINISTNIALDLILQI